MALSRAEKKAIREEAEREAYKQRLIDNKRLDGLGSKILSTIFWMVIIYIGIQATLVYLAKQALG